MQPKLNLGTYFVLGSNAKAETLHLPPHHLTTHCVTLGASGSGKTGAAFGIVEEALRAEIPVLLIDVKGDLPNLGLVFPSFGAHEFMPWVQPQPGDNRSIDEVAQHLADERKAGLEAAGIGEADLHDFVERVEVRVITPGGDGGESLHVLSALEQPHRRWQNDPLAARASLSAAISLVLRLLERDPNAATSRDHVFLSLLAERQLQAGKPSDLATLIANVLEPPIQTVGALPIDSYISPKQRAELAASLNTLLASPSFSAWRQGAALDVGEWLSPKPATIPGARPKTPAVIVSVAHLDDEERTLVLGVLLEELLTWVRGLPGSKALRALIVFDELYGFLPPHPRNPATKPPLVALIKQARAFGVGLVLSTQNPMDLDYRVLSNAGIWYVGRLQTDADRERVVESMAQSAGTGTLSEAALSNVVKQLKNRWFLMRNVHSAAGTLLVQPRYAMSYLRGPMTAAELKRMRGQ